MQNVWDAYKVVICGVLLKMNYENRKNKAEKIDDIQRQIKKKELELTKRPTATNIRLEVKILQLKLQNMLQEEMEKKNEIPEAEIFCWCR